MNREDVIYNVNMSMIFYLKEYFCKKYNFFNTESKTIASAIKNKKYSITDSFFTTDGNGNPSSNVSLLVGGADFSNSSSSYEFLYEDDTLFVKFLNTTKNINISYNSPSVNILDAYPDENAPDFSKQMIVFESYDFYSRPFEVGSNRQYWNIPFSVSFFSFSPVIRYKVSGALSTLFKNFSVPLIDFSDNRIIIDGKLNKNFLVEEIKSSDINDFGNIDVQCSDIESQDKKKMYTVSVSGNIKIIF